MALPELEPRNPGSEVTVRHFNHLAIPPARGRSVLGMSGRPDWGGGPAARTVLTLATRYSNMAKNGCGSAAVFPYLAEFC